MKPVPWVAKAGSTENIFGTNNRGNGSDEEPYRRGGLYAMV